VIRELNPQTREMTTLVRAVAGATEADCAWTPDGWLLMAHGGALYGWRRETRIGFGRCLDALGLRGVTRLAVSRRRSDRDRGAGEVTHTLSHTDSPSVTTSHPTG
jgi:hypothetical protein